MAASAPLTVDHVLNPDHDALKHSAVFEGVNGNFFCVHCAAERYTGAPAFRRLALLDGIRSILAAHHGVPPSLRMGGIDACLPMLYHGVDSTDAGVVQAATDIMLALKDELDDPVGVLASLVSSTVSLGLPRASGHLYLIGQLLTNASHDLALATALGNACFGRSDDHLAHPQAAALVGAADGNGERGGVVPGGGCRGGAVERSVEQVRLRGFGSFLASHAVSASCQDHVKSDVLYVALELLDCCCCCCCCCATAGATAVAPQGQGPSLPPPGSDPFVSIMMSVPRLLAGRPSYDEPLQLHSIAYLATATTYCRLRTEMGVPGWSCNASGVPDVLAALFDGAREFTARETVAGGGCASSLPTSSGGLCNTLKTLLMSSSYRVRSATARLVTALCSDGRSPEEPSTAYEDVAVCGDGGGGRGGGGGRKTSGLFFREVLIAAGATDFLFEAIKSEREGTPRFYLEAAQTFALSPVEFFHADNFSMKFAAPVLLSAFRNGGGGGGGGDDGTGIDSEDKAVVSSLSSRLLLHALVTLPSSGVVEELLATAAASTQLDTADKVRGIGLAADVLSLIASGDISLSKDRGNFLDAVGVLLDHLEEDLACAAHPDALQAPAEAAASSPFGSADQPATCRQDCRDDGGLALQCTRAYESLLHTAEDWVSSSLRGGTALGPSFHGVGRGFRREEEEEEEGRILADLVFTAYACTLRHQCNLIARSQHLTHDIAFLSCLGAAVDAASSVLSHKRRREEESPSSSAGCKNGRARVEPSSQLLLRVRPSFVEVDRISADAPAETDTAVSCLQTVLSVAVEADVVSWMLDLYARCGAEGSSGDGGDACGTTTRELLVEVLQSFLCVQGWVNGLCAHGVECPSHGGDYSSGGDSGVMSDGFSTFGDTVRLVIKSWSASGGEGVASPLDQHALSLLGTNADNGDLCKLAALLVSLSPSFLGMLHPHVGCRLDSAVMLLRYVKTVPEAIFCLNLFSHIILSGDRQAWGSGGGEHLSGLSDAVKDLLARFPVGDTAHSSIPLSAAALLFSLLVGCDAFFADWLVAAPFARIERALGEFWVICGREKEASDDAMDVASSDIEQQAVAVSAQELGREALTGVLEAALSRWGAEIEDSPQHHSPSDAVIYRLASVLSMSPDAYFALAFDEDSQSNDSQDGGRRRRQELSDILGAIIPETLEALSAAMSPVVSRLGDRSNESYRTSKLACVSRVSQLASAFLRARCGHGCYAPTVGGGLHGDAASCSGPEPPEFSLARACGGLLQGLLDPRRGQGSSGGGGKAHGALLSVLNLLNALLVLAGGDSEILRPDAQGLAFALQESHAALLAVVIERLTNWLDLAPDTLAAFLQACVLWNAIESKRNVLGGDASRSRLNPPFQVLKEVLSLGGSGPCAIVERGGGIGTGNNGRLSKPQASASTPRRGVRRSLLQVLAARCVESAAKTRFFSHQEVLALQLTLQGMACDSSATVASAAHEALRALWEAYAGFVQPADLVGQSWNPFMVESSLENALRSLSDDPDDGRVADLLRVGDDPRALRVDPPVAVSTVGRLLRWCEGKACPRLLHSQALVDGGRSGGSLEVLSEIAAVSIHQCTALLATNLRLALGDGLDQWDDKQQIVRRKGGSSGGESGSIEGREEVLISDTAFHLSDALAQMVHVLMCIQPPPQQEGSAVGRGVRWEVVDALLSLHPLLLRSREVRPRLDQVSMPLSSGAYHDCALNYSSEGGVFFVRYDNWRALSSTLEPVSLAVLAREVETLVERLSGRPVGAESTENGEDREVHDGG